MWFLAQLRLVDHVWVVAYDPVPVPVTAVPTELACDWSRTGSMKVAHESTIARISPGIVVHNAGHEAAEIDGDALGWLLDDDVARLAHDPWIVTIGPQATHLVPPGGETRVPVRLLTLGIERLAPGTYGLEVHLRHAVPLAGGRAPCGSEGARGAPPRGLAGGRR